MHPIRIGAFDFQLRCAYAVAVVCTLLFAPGCSKGDVDLAGFTFGCQGNDECPDNQVCGEDDICVDIEWGEGGGEGEGEGEGEEGEAVDCWKRCEEHVEVCPERDVDPADTVEDCAQSCRFVQNQVSEEAVRCIFEHLGPDSCKAEKVLGKCVEICSKDSDCEDSEDSDYICIGGDRDHGGEGDEDHGTEGEGGEGKTRFCAEPTPCYTVLAKVGACHDADGSLRDDKARCVGTALEVHLPDAEEDPKARRAALGSLACMYDCGAGDEVGAGDRPTCDTICDGPLSLCATGADFEEFACRDIVSCVLGTCRAPYEGCRTRCAAPLLDKAQEDAWKDLETCMQHNCRDDRYACFMGQCRLEIDNCAFPIDRHPRPSQPPIDQTPCLQIYECLQQCGDDPLCPPQCLTGRNEEDIVKAQSLVACAGTGASCDDPKDLDCLRSIGCEEDFVHCAGGRGGQGGGAD